MITSQYGIKLLESGDKGDTVFDSINGNFELQRDHSHNGVNAVKINSSDLQKGEIEIPETEWVMRNDGTGWEKTVVFPGGFTLENSSMRFRVISGPMWNTTIYPTILPDSLTTVKIIVGQKVPLQILLT
jgi:hypothetical protein